MCYCVGFCSGQIRLKSYDGLFDVLTWPDHSPKLFNQSNVCSQDIF